MYFIMLFCCGCFEQSEAICMCAFCCLSSLPPFSSMVYGTHFSMNLVSLDLGDGSKHIKTIHNLLYHIGDTSGGFLKYWYPQFSSMLTDFPINHPAMGDLHFRKPSSGTPAVVNVNIRWHLWGSSAFVSAGCGAMAASRVLNLNGKSDDSASATSSCTPVDWWSWVTYYLIHLHLHMQTYIYIYT